MLKVIRIFKLNLTIFFTTIKRLRMYLVKDGHGILGKIQPIFKDRRKEKLLVVKLYTKYH